MFDVDKLAGNLFISPPDLAQHAALAAFQPDTVAAAGSSVASCTARSATSCVPALKQLGFDVPVMPGGRVLRLCQLQSLHRRQLRVLLGCAGEGRRRDHAGSGLRRQRSASPCALLLSRSRSRCWRRGCAGCANSWESNAACPGDACRIGLRYIRYMLLAAALQPIAACQVSPQWANSNLDTLQPAAVQESQERARTYLTCDKVTSE